MLKINVGFLFNVANMQRSSNEFNSAAAVKEAKPDHNYESINDNLRNYELNWTLQQTESQSQITDRVLQHTFRVLLPCSTLTRTK